MKKYLFAIVLLFLNIIFAFGQIMPTDFTANDCNGVSHHLFSELDAGKIIVVSFVEPCTSCIGPSGTAETAVSNYLTAHPGSNVIFYIASDFGTYACASLSFWASLNGLHGANAIFSDPAFVTTQYGPTPFMPKVVVLGGGTSHHIYLCGEGATYTNDSIENAINAAAIATSVTQNKIENSNISVFPNPAKDVISFSYFLSQTSDVNIEIFNLIGSKVYTFSKEKQVAGKHELPIAITNNICNGIYFIKLSAGESSNVLKFIVEK